MIRCKLICIGTREYVGSVRDGKDSRQLLHEASFYAVTSGSDENKAFFSATPTATLTIGSHSITAFQAGKSYYVDLTEAP